MSGTLSDRTRKRDTVIGTPFFLAPEIIHEVGYDFKADIWSLGISAIELGEGEPPYFHLHPMRVLFMIGTNPPPSFTEPEKWSPEINEFLSLCLAKDPKERFSAKKLLQQPLMKKSKGPEVLAPLISQVQEIIGKAGGIEAALKEVSRTSSSTSRSRQVSFLVLTVRKHSNRMNLLDRKFRQIRILRENTNLLVTPSKVRREVQIIDHSFRLSKLNTNNPIPRPTKARQNGSASPRFIPLPFSYDLQGQVSSKVAQYPTPGSLSQFF